MDRSTGLISDVELSASDVQSLNNADAVAALFARLSYNINERTEQAPGNLGITADGTVRPIRRIELIANQDGLLQVYLFELTSVTIAQTRALARVFRNRAGNYLLILTSDYESLDFVLLEKYLPPEGDGGSSLGAKQVGIRPRVLTVNRRKPGPVDLRVLRRFTWTESDPFAQYEKLLSAYSVADWSEEHFNNRALFSDYYLKERLKGLPEWSEDPKPTYRQLRDLYLGAASKFASKEENFLRKGLLEPTLKILSFVPEAGKQSASSAAEPDYHLYSSSEPHRGSERVVRAHCLAYPWGRSLDGKDDQRDRETPDENPAASVVSLLEKGQAAWIMVTNGKLWRLYSQHTHSRATNYYEIDLEEALALTSSGAAQVDESFRYFWLLFRCRAFEPAPVRRDGKEEKLTFLDRLRAESEDYAKELGERLKKRVFEQIFPHLAAGFIAHMRAHGQDARATWHGHPAHENVSENQPSDRRRDVSPSHAGMSEETLRAVFQGTLTLLYRLLFLLYAEARDLLPVREVRGFFEASLTHLNREVAEAAGAVADEAGTRLKKHFRDDSTQLYDRLLRLFQVVDRGDGALNVPVYNGGLFLSEPNQDDDSPEAQAARFLNATKVPDRFLAQALNLLSRDVDDKRQDLVFIDYKSLGVRQLGSIYEGLLEFKLRIAGCKLAIVKEKNREVYSELTELGEKEQERAECQGRVVKKGQVYLENDKRERRATGSYYTPDHIVQYIVEHAVGPVLREKFEAMRPKLREAQKWHHDMTRLAKAKREPVSKYDFGPAVEHKWGKLVDELFDVKVLDPAMGSGHFLVEAVDYITDKTLDFLNAFPWNPVVAHLRLMRETILREMDEQGITIDAKRLTDVNLLKRQVLKRCIYGVDLNPMAVELAKVSLWLDCFTLGAPLSFLDHHLRCGNSLIGVTVKEVKEAVEGKGIETDPSDVRSQMTLFGSRFAGLLLATDLMRHVGELSDVTSAQVRESRLEYRKASDALAPFKRILDVYTSQWFGNGGLTKSGSKKKAKDDSRAVEFLKSREAEPFVNAREQQALKRVMTKLSPSDLDIAERALAAADEKRFFHWELEFPEVFYGPRPGTTQTIERLEGAGFDAVIGNPPYDEPSEYYSDTTEEDKAFFSNFKAYSPFKNGRVNLYRLFIVRGFEQAKETGFLSCIVPMTILADDFSRPTREFMLCKRTLRRVEAFPQKDDPNRRVFREAKLSTCVFVSTGRKADSNLFVRTNSANYIEQSSPSYETTAQDLARVFRSHITIPTISDVEWSVLQRGFEKDWPTLREIAEIYVGEVFDNAPNKKYLANEAIGPLVLRGANIDRYLLRKQASQGQNRYLRERLFLDDKQRAAKLEFLAHERIGLQRGAAVDNWRRLIACEIPPRVYSFDTVLLLLPKRIGLRILLALVNSDLWEWRFRCTSTTNHVNEYELADLVVPPALLDQTSVDSKRLQTLVDAVLDSPPETVRRSEVQLAPEQSADLRIDDIVFAMYGLDERDISVIRAALRRVAR